MSRKRITIENDVPEGFLRLFTKDGPFHETVVLSDQPGNSVDLHFRNRQGKSPLATLYLGTSKVVDFEYDKTRNRIKIKRQASKKIFGDSTARFAAKHPAAEDAWGKWQSVDEASDSWLREGAGHDLIDLVQNERSEAARKRSGTEGEGFLQAGLVKNFRGVGTIINRESIVSFPDEESKQKALSDVMAPIYAMLDGLRSEPWVRSDKGFGGKLDALAIDNDGNLLAIEVKGGYDTAGVGWTPAQVAVYKRLLEVWWNDDPEAARQSLVNSLEQRRKLGLAGKQEIAETSKFRIIPVIVIGEIASDGSARTASKRMRMVRDHLGRAGEQLEGLRIYQLSGPNLKCREIQEGEDLTVSEPTE
jgi:hypothetical protein